MAYKTINVRIDSDLHILMKQYIVTHDSTIARFLEDAIANFLRVEKVEGDKWAKMSES